MVRTSALKKSRPKKTADFDGWANAILLRAHAIAPCPDHGFMKLRFDHAAVAYAHALAAMTPFRGMTAEQSMAALDDHLDTFGDQCPACF